MLKSILKHTYIYLIIALFYIPLLIGVVYSLSAGGKLRNDMPIKFQPTYEGWNQLSNNVNVFWSLMNSLWVALVVAGLVVALGLITTFGLWRQRNKVARPFVTGTSSIPLINPDIITAISLSVAFGALFGIINVKEASGMANYIRLIASHVAMILPFAITLMLPRSDKFKLSLIEASKDLGYGPVKTWFKTYFRHMIPVAIASFGIAFMMSLDDFVVGRIVFTTNRQNMLLGQQMYIGKVKPWVLALGTIMLAATLLGTATFAVIITRKERKLRKVKR